jgi:hypothetical protein
MPIRFQIPRVLQQHCAGRAELNLHADTVGGLLNDLRQDHPELYRCICDETGTVRPHLQLFLNGQFLHARDGRDRQLKPGDTKGELSCGVEPAALFHSPDHGDSWELVEGISNHEHARQWQPGNGGLWLCLHTIVRDATRMHLGISTGGHYLSEDGGRSFAAANRGVGAGFVPDPYPEFGQCVHKIVSHPAAPGRLYMQNHGGWGEWHGPGGPRPDIGVLRSDDHGHTWRSIAKGLPSDFGFPIVVHPRDPDVAYVMPLHPQTRACPGGAPAVWRSSNGGDSWQKLARGLPPKESYFTVLRDAMTIDDAKAPALYFGTTTGQLWLGRDGGQEWSCLFDSLPPIYSVKVAVI